MPLTAPCTITIDKKIIKISAANGRTVAEIIVEGPFEVCMFNAINNRPIIKGTANIFRGELIPLERDEYLDSIKQEIVVRSPRLATQAEIEEPENTIYKK